MSAISNLLNQIKTAIYGEEVRDSIHDAIEQCYTDVSTGVTLANTAANNANAKATAANNAASAANTAANAANTATSNMDSKINDVALVQANQPSSATNKIWVQPQSDEYQVPTWEEFSDVKSAVSNRFDMLPSVELFDVTGITEGYYISSTGAEVASDAWCISNYITIPLDSPLKYSGVSNMGLAVRIGIYDENKTFVRGIVYNADVVSHGYFEQIGENEKYVRFSLKKAELNNFTCSKIEVQTIIKEVEIGKFQGLTPVKTIEDTAITGYWSDQSKDIITNSGYKALSIYPVKKGDIVRCNHAGYRPLVLYDADGNVLDLRTYGSSVARYYTIYEVVADGLIGLNYNSNYADYEVFINNSKVILKGTLDWLDINIPEGITWSTWVGKRGAMFGDSLVSGQRDDSEEGGAYCRRLKEHLSLTACTNYGRSGHPVADGTPNGAGTVTTVMAVSSYADIDLVIIAGGTNDFKLNVPIGTLQPNGGTFDRNTFYGALQTIAEYLMNKKPNIRICMWTPLQRDNDGYTSFSTNTAGHTLSDYCDAIKEFNISGVNMLNLAWYTADGLHLNGQGYDVVSYIGAKQINVL